jgi:hypothetical protein
MSDYLLCSPIYPVPISRIFIPILENSF